MLLEKVAVSIFFLSLCEHPLRSFRDSAILFVFVLPFPLFFSCQAQEEELNRLKSNQKEEEQGQQEEGHSLVSYQPKDVQLSPLITSANRAFACASHIKYVRFVCGEYV